MNPAGIYRLIPEKTYQTKDRLLEALVHFIPMAQPTPILTDFESAATQAFKLCFPGTTITGCYFHLSQSILRKVSEVRLKVVYETNSNMREFIRSSAALIHVPVSDFPNAFNQLTETAPNIPQLDEVRTYFEHLSLQ